MDEKTNYLAHHGVQGQRWGIRRYQNRDGSLTSAGKEKLKKYKDKETIKANKRWDRYTEKLTKKYNKQKSKTNPNKKKIDKLTIELGQAKVTRILEQKAIKNMSYKDMKKEKRAYASGYVKTILGTAAGAALLPTAMVSLGSPVAVRAFYISDPTANKLGERIKRMKKIEAQKKY